MTINIERDKTIDALRGLAAFAVLVGHLLAAAHRETQDELTRHLSSVLAIQFVDWGRFGVVLFFLISGYVVPEYLIRGGSLRAFAVQRLSRINPTFWASIVFTVGVSFALVSTLPNISLIYANATLFPNVFRQEWLSGVYWTLNIEILFYLVCLAGAKLQCISKPKWWIGASLLMVGATAIPICVNYGVGKAIVPVQFTTFYVAFLASGVLLRIYDRNASDRIPSLLVALIPFALTPLVAGMFFPVRGAFVAHNPLATTIGHLLGLAVFLALVLYSLIGLNRFWLSVGESNYSLYLFHWPICAVVISLVGFGSLAATFFVCLASIILSLLAAKYLYLWLERPSIELGRWIRFRLET